MCLNAGAMGRCDAETETLIPTAGCDVAHSLRAEGFDAGEDGTGRGTPLVPVAYQTSGNCGAWETGSHANAGVTPAVASISENIRGEVVESEISRALQTSGGKPGRGYVAARIGSAVRRLTPTECERLQAFPDGWTKIEWRGKPADQCPDGPRYKALGNSMAVNVMAWIGERIAAVDAAARGAAS